MTTVANIKKGEPYTLYIGRENRHYGKRESFWANPFLMDMWHSREDVLGLYYWYLCLSPDKYNSLAHLRNQVLGCYCVPNACHGHLLAWLSDGLALPDVKDPYCWQECQFCHAPFMLWNRLVDPLAVYQSGNKDALYDSRNFIHINGMKPHQRQIVGCMTCQKTGMYAMHPEQLRTGTLELTARERMQKEIKLRYKLGMSVENLVGVGA